MILIDGIPSNFSKHKVGDPVRNTLQLSITYSEDWSDSPLYTPTFTPLEDALRNHFGIIWIIERGVLLK